MLSLFFVRSTVTNMDNQIAVNGGAVDALDSAIINFNGNVTMKGNAVSQSGGAMRARGASTVNFNK